VNSENRGIPRIRLAAAVIVSLLVGGAAGYLIGTSGGWGEPEPIKGKIRLSYFGCKDKQGNACEAYRGNDKMEGYCYCQNDDLHGACYQALCVEDGTVSDKPTTKEP